MIKAASLFYAIVISIIIAIISSSLILFAYLHRIEFDNLQTQQRLNSNTNSGLNLLMAQQSLVEVGQQKIIDLYGMREDSVFLSRQLWGAFEILVSRAIFRNRQQEQVAFSGCPTDSSNLYCLYLADENKPLALCGNTKIKGTAFLPKAGVERAYIEGQNFIGSQLVTGAIKKSKNELPVFNPLLLKNMQHLLEEKRLNDTDSLLQITRPFSGDSIHNSFKNNTLILSKNGPVRIENGTYSGNIIITSDTVIVVASSAILKDIILAAPKIIIEESFIGYLQIFATDSIIVKKNVSFHYPSVLGLVSKTPADQCAIVLNENDSLTGNIFVNQVRIDGYVRAGIRIGKKCVVTGQIYCNGYVELQGSVYGSLMCSKFLLVTPSSVYENHLLNAVIDQYALPGYFTGITWSGGSRQKKIVKWVD